MASPFSDLFDLPPGKPQGQLFVQAYAELLRRIASLELAPGDTFAESALAERLRLGKTPVREALIVVREMGLVEAHAGSGYTVRPVDDIPGLWRCEAMLAREAAAAIGRGPMAAHPLGGLLGQVGRFAPLFDTALSDYDEVSISNYVRAGQFGRTLFVAASGNPYLNRMASQLHTNLERSIRLALRALAEQDRLPPPLHDGALVVAAATGDGETARRLLATRPDRGAWVVEALGLSGTT